MTNQCNNATNHFSLSTNQHEPSKLGDPKYEENIDGEAEKKSQHDPDYLQPTNKLLLLHMSGPIIKAIKIVPQKCPPLRWIRNKVKQW